jgi:flagellar hook-associated protein 1
VQSVTQVNSLTSQIASVDQQISNLQSVNQNPGTLVDQQNNLIQQLSGLIDVQVIPTGQGITVATSNGTTLVSGSQSFALTTQTGSDGVQHIWRDAQRHHQLADRWKPGRFDPDSRPGNSRHGQQSRSAGSRAWPPLNTANAQGFDLNGNAGGNIFAPPPANGVGAAATMTVTMTDPSLLAASSDGTAGSNGNLANLSAVADQERWPTGRRRSMLFQPGSSGKHDLQYFGRCRLLQR